MLAPLSAAPSAALPVAAWLDTIAAHLLGGVQIIAGTDAYLPVEIEAYYAAPGHPDPFVHGHPVQQRSGRWYFHRAGDAYRGGSFKGLDITIGAPGTCGGILLRTLRAVSDDAVICGPSLCVDRLLASTGHARVAALDAAVGTRTVDDPTSPLHLRARVSAAAPEPIWQTARVGLTLKRAPEHPEMARYIGRPYRYLTDARAVKKGRVQLILALYAAGHPPDQIRGLTGSPARTIADAISAYEAGKTLDIAQWYGQDLGTGALCRLYGAWSGVYGG